MPANNPVTKIEEKRECYYFRIPGTVSEGKRIEERGEKERKEKHNWFIDKVPSSDARTSICSELNFDLDSSKIPFDSSPSVEIGPN